MAVNMASHFRNLTNFEAFIPSTPILEYSPLGKVYIESWNVIYSGEKIDDFRQSFTDSDDDIVDTPQLNWSKFSAVAEIGRATVGHRMFSPPTPGWILQMKPTSRQRSFVHSPRAGRKTGLDYSPVLKYIVVVYPTMEETYKVITTSWQSPLQKKNWSHSIYLI